MVSFSSFMRGAPKWVSEAQEKGMKALMLHLQNSGRLTDANSIWATFAWFIQKDHEAQEFLVKLMGDQVSSLQDQIKLLQEQNRALAAKVQTIVEQGASSLREEKKPKEKAEK